MRSNTKRRCLQKQINETTARELHSLPDDCLLEIWQRLVVSDRLRIENVSQRWADLMHFTYQKENSLNIAQQLAAPTLEPTKTDEAESLIVAALLTRCGPYLKELTFGAKWFRLTPTITQLLENNCKNIRKLDLSHTIAAGNIIPFIEQLAPQLVELNLDDTHWIFGSHCTSLKDLLTRMPNLRSLNLRKASFNLNFLSKLPSTLQEVNLNNTTTPTDELERFLAQAQTHLQVLRLASVNNVSEAMLSSMSGMASLRVLDLSHMRSRGQAMSLRQLLNGLNPHIEQLHLQHNDWLSDADFRQICLKAKKLKLLNVANCKQLSNYACLEHCSSPLEQIIIKNASVSDRDLSMFAKSKAAMFLTHLHLENCSAVSNAGLADILANCTRLSDLHLKHCLAINDDFLHGLARSSIQLASLSVHGTGVTEKGLTSLADSTRKLLENLKDLDVSFCKNISDECVLSLYEVVKQQQSPRPASSKRQRLSMVVHQTGVSYAVGVAVSDRICLMY